MSKIVFEQLFSKDVQIDEGGKALISNVNEGKIDGEDTNVYLAIISFDENKEHKDFNKFTGKKVKITIETI